VLSGVPSESHERIARHKSMSNPRKLMLSILLLGLLASTILNLGVRAQDARRVVFDRSAFFGSSTPLPQWDNGYLISREVESFQAGASNVRLYDTSGRLVRAASIWFPGATRVLIYSATATSDGRIIAGGTTEKQDGTASSFIARTDATGKIADVIQTKGFSPMNICEAPDGTVWSFGGTGFDKQKYLQPNPGDALRHFDFHKGEVASYLARSSFPNHPQPEVRAQIRCSAGEVVAYSSHARTYIEMKYSGDTPQVYHVEEPSGLQFRGFAMTDLRKIYAYFSKLGKGGLYCLSFDDSSNTARWLPVAGTVGTYTTPGVIIGLWGSDGDNLIVSRAEDPTGEIALHWSPPVDQ